VNKHALETYQVTPLQLHLFDGSTNSIITQAIDIHLHFVSGNITPTTLKERTKEGQLEGSIRTNAKLFPGSLFGWGRCTSEINGICSTYPSVLANFYLCVSLKISEK